MHLHFNILPLFGINLYVFVLILFLLTELFQREEEI